MITAYQIRRYFEGYTQSVFVAVAPNGNILTQHVVLELPWRDNQRRVSCIPEGTYNVDAHTSPKFGLCFEIQDVPNRSAILQHPGNYTTQIKGCQLHGAMFKDLNLDNLPDVAHTRDTLTKMLGMFGTRYRLIITAEAPPAFAHSISPATLLPIVKQ